MTDGMSAQRNPTGVAYWARILELDFLSHGHRRSTAAIARDLELPERRLLRWMNEGYVPSADQAARIARRVGMPDAEFVELLAAPIRSAGDTDTLE